MFHNIIQLRLSTEHIFYVKKSVKESVFDGCSNLKLRSTDLISVIPECLVTASEKTCSLNIKHK